MLDLQNITIAYLNQRFQPELLEVIISSCSVLQKFNLTNYENELVEIIVNANELDNNEVRDRFIGVIRTQMLSLIAEHFITIDEDSDVQLKELNEIGLFLLLLSNLENTDQIAYRVYGLGTGRQIFIDLMDIYTSLPRIRLMEILSSVDDRLINAIRAMTEDKGEKENTLGHQRLHWVKFTTFIGKVDCLGVRLYTEGYFGLSLEEILKLSRSNLQEYFTQTVKVRPSQAALDILSLLYMSHDFYQVPLSGFDKNSINLLTDSDDTGRLRVLISSMISDFSTWLEAQRTGLSAGKGVIA